MGWLYGGNKGWHPRVRVFPVAFLPSGIFPSDIPPFGHLLPRRFGNEDIIMALDFGATIVDLRLLAYHFPTVLCGNLFLSRGDAAELAASGEPEIHQSHSAVLFIVAISVSSILLLLGFSPIKAASP